MPYSFTSLTSFLFLLQSLSVDSTLLSHHDLYFKALLLGVFNRSSQATRASCASALRYALMSETALATGTCAKRFSFALETNAEQELDPFGDRRDDVFLMTDDDCMTCTVDILQYASMSTVTEIHAAVNRKGMFSHIELQKLCGIAFNADYDVKLRQSAVQQVYVMLIEDEHLLRTISTNAAAELITRCISVIDTFISFEKITEYDGLCLRCALIIRLMMCRCSAAVEKVHFSSRLSTSARGDRAPEYSTCQIGSLLTLFLQKGITNGSAKIVRFLAAQTLLL